MPAESFAYKVDLDRYKTNPPDYLECSKGDKLTALIYFLAANPAYPLSLKDGQKVSFQQPKTKRWFSIENHEVRL